MARIAIWLSVIVLPVLPGCRRAVGPDVVAEVGDRRIPYQEFSDYVAAAVGGRAEGLDSKVLAALFDEFLDQAIADQLASVEVPPGTPRDRAFEVWVDALEVPVPTNAELQARFRRQKRSLPRRAVLRQLVLPSEEQALAARREIIRGASFAAVADRLNAAGEFQSAGGLQGTFAAADLPRQVAADVFALEPGTVSEVFAMQHGFTLFEVDRFLPAQEQRFEQVRDELLRQMLAERRQQVLDARIGAFRSDKNVTIYLGNLPFDYVGAYEDLADE